MIVFMVEKRGAGEGPRTGDPGSGMLAGDVLVFLLFARSFLAFMK